jgi:hypothetical protein
MQKLNDQDLGPEDLMHLADTLDGFSLVTYDFSGPQNPGPGPCFFLVQQYFSVKEHCFSLTTN